MATITQYAVEDGEGNQISSAVFDEDEYREAKQLAREESACVVAYEFEYSDSYTVDDFTETVEVTYSGLTDRV